jgi:5-methylthioadenosine/S-adenosylhomocysteine deaminase
MDCGEQFGVRTEIMQPTPKIESDIRRLHAQYQGSENGRLQIWMAPAIPWGSSVENMQMTKRLYDELDMHMTVHTAETMLTAKAPSRCTAWTIWRYSTITACSAPRRCWCTACS